MPGEAVAGDEGAQGLGECGEVVGGEGCGHVRFNNMSAVGGAMEGIGAHAGRCYAGDGQRTVKVGTSVAGGFRMGIAPTISALWFPSYSFCKVAGCGLLVLMEPS